MMLKKGSSKLKILLSLVMGAFLMSMNIIAYGVEFNDDIQQVSLDYYYFEGFGEDKIIKSVQDGTWYLLKADGHKIELEGKYLDYAYTVIGKYYSFNDDYYRFVIGNNNGSTRFTYVDKNGEECLVNGYTASSPTLNERYYLLINDENDGSSFYGLYDKYNKKEVIPLVYNSLSYYSDDRIIAFKDDKYGIIDIKQNVILPFEYSNIQYINDNFIIAKKDGKTGVVDIKNQNILPFVYDDIFSFSYEDYCKIVKDGKAGLIDPTDAEIAIPIEYDDVSYAGNKMAVVQKDGKQGVLNTNNEVVVPLKYDFILVYEKAIVVYKDEKAGVLDKEGNEILPVKAKEITELFDEYFTSMFYDRNNEVKYAVYDYTGKELVPPKYDYVDYDSSDKYMIARDIYGTNIYDKKTGEKILKEERYADIKYVNDKYFAGGFPGSLSIVNFAGQQLTSGDYNSISIKNINGEEFIAAELNSTKRFDRKFDYFKPVKGPSAWAIDEVSEAIEHNLVPYDYQAAFTLNIKRYEFCSIIVSFLEEYFNITRDEIKEDNNIDAVNPPTLDYYNEDVSICLHLGIVRGRGNGYFDGNSEITREEAAVMLTNLARYMGLDSNSDQVHLNDKRELSKWAYDSVNFVLKCNVMQGMGNDMFSPKSGLTREQAYIIMNRLLKL
nr:WG repeat-containing protein [Sedimentibacter sp.]